VDPFRSEGIGEQKSLLTLVGIEVSLLCLEGLVKMNVSSTFSLFGLIIRIPKKKIRHT